MTVMPQTSTLLQHHHDYLMCHRRGEVNEPLLAQMYASWMCHQGAMPLYLGLSLDVFRSMMAYHFPSLPDLPLPQTVTGLQAERLPELDDLRALLHQFHSQPPPDAGWMVEIVCAGCMGNNHLWQDLGLWSRRDLSQLMQTNFHDLAAQNTKDMKWKKFLYKQLCEAEGIYVCRAPSCEVCVDYAMCFNTPEVMP